MTADERRQAIHQAFVERYGAAPTLWTRAPGRVDLMGSHTDYNHGFILTMTIDRDTWLAARPRADRTVRVASLNAAGSDEFSLDDLSHNDQLLWPNYVRAMAWVIQEAGYSLTGFDGLIHTTVPLSSGLSSSAALEMAVGRLCEQLGGWSIDAVELAILGQRAENRFVGVNCGILDQYTSAVGQAGCALLLDARSLTSRAVPIAPGIQVVICDTQIRRELAGSEYDQRRAQCEDSARRLAERYPGVTHLRDVSPAQFDAAEASLPPETAQRSRFIVEENERVLALAAALAGGDRPAIHDLCTASFAGARDLYAITVPQMQIMEAAMLAAPGSIGARQAGAGFGGCMVAFVEQAAVETFQAQVSSAYRAAAGIVPKIYPVQPAAGAGAA